jgi:hypothetical protein
MLEYRTLPTLISRHMSIKNENVLKKGKSETRYL